MYSVNSAKSCLLSKLAVCVFTYTKQSIRQGLMPRVVYHELSWKYQRSIFTNKECIRHDLQTARTHDRLSQMHPQESNGIERVPKESKGIRKISGLTSGAKIIPQDFKRLPKTATEFKNTLNGLQREANESKRQQRDPKGSTEKPKDSKDGRKIPTSFNGSE